MLPDLTYTKILALDTEAYTPFLTKTGERFLTGEDYPLGFSYAADTGEKDYIPVAHEEGNSLDQWLPWLKHQLSRSDLTVVMAFAKFDLMALYRIGIVPTCKIEDVQVLDALLDENQKSYSLDSISLRRLGQQKLELPVGVDKNDLRNVPPSVLSPYAIRDAELTLLNFQSQVLEIEAQGLTRVRDLERRLIPILHRMHIRGIKVDVERAAETNERLKLELGATLATLKGVDPWASASIAKWVRGLGFEPPRTALGADSLTNEWLLATQHPECVRLANYRKDEKARRDFYEGVILERSLKGRIHPSWHSTRGSGFMSGDDTNGTRSGRLACTSPNLQQSPARHPVHGPLFRSLFLAEEGQHWLSADYQAQEIRIGLHYANALGLDGAQAMVDRYVSDPMLDYHAETMNGINSLGSTTVTRAQAKECNLSIQYGIGKVKLSKRLGMPLSETEKLLESFHSAVPYVKQALKACQNVADQRGYVKTYLGRRRRFEEWENGTFGEPWEKPLPEHEARAKWPRVKRAGTFRAFNSIVQGTGAEMMKLAIVEAVDQGFDVSATIHDELALSLDNPEKVVQVKELMENVIKLNVPIMVTTKIGSSWGTAK